MPNCQTTITTATTGGAHEEHLHTAQTRPLPPTIATATVTATAAVTVTPCQVRRPVAVRACTLTLVGRAQKLCDGKNKSTIRGAYSYLLFAATVTTTITPFRSYFGSFQDVVRRRRRRRRRKTTYPLFRALSLIWLKR